MKNFFELSKEEAAISKLLYGRIVKCIVAPYHTVETFQLDKYLSKEIGDITISVFPENRLTIPQRRTFIEDSISNKAKVVVNDDLYIVTSDLQIILDLPKGCIRVLSKEGKLYDCPEKTFVANPHTVLFNVLEISETENFGTKVLNKVINELNSKKEMKEQRYKDCIAIHRLIGEPVISNAMENLFEKVKVENGLNDPRQLEITRLERELERLNKIKAEREREKKSSKKK